MQKQYYLNFTLKHRKMSCLKMLPVMTTVLLGNLWSLKWAYYNNSKYSVLKLYSNVLCCYKTISYLSELCFFEKRKSIVLS